MSYTLSYSLNLGPAYAATADLRAQLVDTSGANVGSAISAGFVIIGNGFHLWTYASMPDDHRGGVKFYSNAASSTVLGFLSVNPEEAEYTDVKTSTRLSSGSYTTPPTAAAIDTQLSGTHGAGSWATATGFATPTNVTNAQTAITNAISALNDLDSTEAQAAVAAALAAYLVETGHTLQTVLQRLYAVSRGRAVANDATTPTAIDYYAADNTTIRVAHVLTSTERTVS